MTCRICNHAKRIEIEQELLSRNWDGTTSTLKDIAKKYKIDEKELQVHSVMHFTPFEDLEGTLEEKDKNESLSDKLKLRESSALTELAMEYLKTVKNVGLRLNLLATSPDVVQLRGLTSPMVDLYLGAGKNAKEILETILKMEQYINGDKESGLESLANLINAIKESDPNDGD